MAARLEALFTAEREEEWNEFLAECTKFDREIAKEIRIKKFTAAELDEEEQNLERLARWFRELRTRDLFGSLLQRGGRAPTQRLHRAARRIRRTRLRAWRWYMKATKTQVLPAPEQPMTGAMFAQHTRTVVAHHGERILAEVPTTLRRLGALFLVLSISLPVFFVGLLVVLWHLAR